MTVNDSDHLIELLAETHSRTLALLKGIDLEMQVYEDGSWQIRDILGHIATWDRQVALSLRAFNQGSEHFIPDFDEATFNNEDVKRQSILTSQQLFEEWEAAREVFKDAVREVPRDLYPGDLLYPWGDERGTLANLVREMCEHDQKHYNEIAKAINSLES